MSTSSRRHGIDLPATRVSRPARLAIEPTGPCVPGIHFGKKSVAAPGLTGISSLAWQIPRGASEASTCRRIGADCSSPRAHRPERNSRQIANEKRR